MLLAAAVISLSVYKTPTMDEPTAAHFTSAMTAQGVGAEAMASARALLFDALGPGGGRGARTHKCLSFEITIANPDRFQCRPFHLSIDGLSLAVVEGTLCPRDGAWTEGRGVGMISSTPLDLRWRDASLKKGAGLYNEPDVRSFLGSYEWPESRIEVSGYYYREALTFAHIRLPNGDDRYVLKDDVMAEPARSK